MTLINSDTQILLHSSSTFSGEGHIDQLRLEISHNFDAGIKTIILDCGHIELMNSSLLGVLVAILRQVHQCGAERMSEKSNS